MNYNYELSFAGIVFYIGSTSAPLFRYKSHCSGTCITDRLIHWMVVNNKLPDFKLLYHNENWGNVIKNEYRIITEYVVKGHKLCNIDGNLHENILDLPAIGYSPKPRLKHNYAKHIQDYINEYNKINNIINDK